MTTVTATRHADTASAVGTTAHRTDVTPAIKAEGLTKRYGDRWALRDLDLEVPAGSVLGLLGHNGAGKTTTIRILTTLARPTAGRARVAGHDVVADPGAVRARIGVAGQEATVDGLLTARANLAMIGRLHGMDRSAARRRADALLERFALSGEADHLAKTFSGGMRRRLDLAAALVARPPVLFLDEPTTGLDPRSRNDLWDLLLERVRGGTTLLLTTQYLEEADRLADDVVVLEHGRAVAHGTPSQLKAQIGGDRIEITLAERRGADLALAAVAPYATRDPSVDPATGNVIVPVPAGLRLLEVVRALDDAAVDLVDLNRRRATLDDVFLTLTATTSPGASP